MKQYSKFLSTKKLNWIELKNRESLGQTDKQDSGKVSYSVYFSTRRICEGFFYFTPIVYTK